ncbi:uncharacterized protein LOC115215450 [Octopus sinensis]|uniref:Uncharacterized protein LOC115215450 n=1 Tax=Octopus sinensis TaxID=2607531 RepID=A0A6P7SQ21_9MOLL|nr:uncharacterized protein LOC115215450 [Octopus sinensis]
MSLEGSECKLEEKLEMEFPISYSPISGDEDSQASGEGSSPAVTPEKESAVTPGKKAPAKKFAEVVGRKQKNINIENLDKYEDLLKKEGNEIAVKKDVEKKEEIEKKRIIYKTYSMTTKSIQKVEECKIEECLKAIRKDITYINRGRRFGTVEVRFRTEEIAKRLSTEPQKAGNLVLLPLYKGRRTSKIVMRNIPPEADASCLVAAVMLGLKEKINILQATVEEEGFWQGQIITMAIQAEAQTLEEIPEVLRLDEEERVLVFVEGRKPRCFGCGKKGHVRAECQPKPQVEAPSEKEEAEKKKKTEETKEVEKAASGAEKEKENEKEEGWSKVTKKKRKTETTPQEEENLKKRKEVTSSFMAIKATNNRLVNVLAAMAKVERIRKMKDFIIYKIGRKDYRRIKSEFFHDVGPLRLDMSPYLYEGLRRTPPRAKEKNKSEEEGETVEQAKLLI